MQNWFKSKDFYGCVFINAVAEHDKGNSWIQETANLHREKSTLAASNGSAK